MKHSLVKAYVLTAILTALTVLGMTGCDARIVSSPIPKGHVEIHVEFEDLSTGDYNKLTAFVQELPKEYLTGFDRDFSSSHGFWNDGFVDQRYKPNHPVPSPKVEKAMRARLETFLQGNGIDVDSVKLQLRYGDGESAGDTNP